jgi:hypothetical protein
VTQRTTAEVALTRERSGHWPFRPIDVESGAYEIDADEAGHGLRMQIIPDGAVRITPLTQTAA